MKPARADAVRNRHKILATAEAAFARDGLAVSVDDIARRAGVGIGTLYRHFPTKDALIAAIVIARIERVAERAEQLAGSPAPGAALVELLEHMVAEGATKRDLVEALGGTEWFETAAVETARRRYRRALAKLLTRAQDAGEIRGDVTASDLTAIVKGLFAANVDARARGRLLRILLDGLRLRRSSLS
jgi:AcrR family transcriptional regulator